MSIEELLARVPIFAGLNKDQLAGLAGLVVRRSFPRGQVLIREGDTDAALYIIVSGEVSVTKRGAPGNPDLQLATQGPGAFVGEMTLLDGSPRSATVTALSPTECLVLTRWVFNTTLRSDPLIAVAMLPVLSQRIRSAEEVTRKASS
ncbi:MAG TPA: cyclic nucleotide-binding domain-containing protein [Chloroflexia bacterium]|nr:cyclic nucleotide-binding domain-containing protein [Chloroflexia bacterium]